ncbi:MAG TPA: hypothetical protein VL856_11635 [Acidimicrobiia bacterium]|nr:hypothetical protein [Acidimicrobiia bacterium]
MAPVLQCPDCGRKHPLASVPDSGTFPCAGCGRMLKVPETVPSTAQAGAQAAADKPPIVIPAPDPPASATQVMRPVVERNPAAPPPSAPAPVLAKGPTSRFVPVALWMRLLLWCIAVPLSFFIVFVLARAFGVFTSEQLSDVFLADGLSRFWPVIRLLPFVALLTAVLVQAGVYLLGRRRGAKKANKSSSAKIS